MLINASFWRKQKGKTETKSITNIQINDLKWKNSHGPIIKQICQYKPAGEGWMLAGYCLIKE